jgi:CRISPR-associated protein Csm4
LIWYCVKLKLKSWTASSWQADTIFGHLCWGMRYLQGAESLQNLLHRYDHGQPPLLLTNGFPCDYLPVPVMPVPTIDSSLPLDKQKLVYEQNKENKKIKLLSRSDFNRIIKGEVPEMKDSPPSEKHRVTLKNQINRLTDTTGDEGNLFNFEEQYYPEITIYLKLENDFIETAGRLFGYLAESGYGKRKSVGYGRIEEYSFEPFSGFDSPANPNGFISLSNFVPAHSDPVAGYWKILTKYGKMGEEYSLEDQAFKKPLVMLEAGSTFYANPVKEFYGCLVKNLNSNYPESVQYAFALTVPMILPAPIV